MERPKQLRRGVLALALLLLFQTSNAGTRKLRDIMPLERGAPRRGLLWAQPDYSIYHTREDLLKQVADIVAANPSFMKVCLTRQGTGGGFFWGGQGAGPGAAGGCRRTEGRHGGLETGKQLRVRRPGPSNT